MCAGTAITGPAMMMRRPFISTTRVSPHCSRFFAVRVRAARALKRKRPRAHFIAPEIRCDSISVCASAFACHTACARAAGPAAPSLQRHGQPPRPAPRPLLSFTRSRARAHGGVAGLRWTWSHARGNVWRRGAWKAPPRIARRPHTGCAPLVPTAMATLKMGAMDFDAGVDCQISDDDDDFMLGDVASVVREQNAMAEKEKAKAAEHQPKAATAGTAAAQSPVPAAIQTNVASFAAPGTVHAPPACEAPSVARCPSPSATDTSLIPTPEPKDLPTDGNAGCFATPAAAIAPGYAGTVIGAAAPGAPQAGAPRADAAQTPVGRAGGRPATDTRSKGKTVGTAGVADRVAASGTSPDNPAPSSGPSALHDPAARSQAGTAQVLPATALRERTRVAPAPRACGQAPVHGRGMSAGDEDEDNAPRHRHPAPARATATANHTEVEDGTPDARAALASGGPAMDAADVTDEPEVCGIEQLAHGTAYDARHADPAQPSCDAADARPKSGASPDVGTNQVSPPSQPVHDACHQHGVSATATTAYASATCTHGTPLEARSAPTMLACESKQTPTAPRQEQSMPTAGPCKPQMTTSVRDAPARDANQEDCPPATHTNQQPSAPNEKGLPTSIPQGTTAVGPVDKASSKDDDDDSGVEHSQTMDDIIAESTKRLERLGTRTQELILATEDTRLRAAFAATSLLLTTSSPLRIAQEQTAMRELEQGLAAMLDDAKQMEERCALLLAETPAAHLPSHC